MIAVMITIIFATIVMNTIHLVALMCRVTTGVNLALMVVAYLGAIFVINMKLTFVMLIMTQMMWTSGQVVIMRES